MFDKAPRCYRDSGGLVIREEDISNSIDEFFAECFSNVVDGFTDFLMQ